MSTWISTQLVTAGDLLLAQQSRWEDLGSGFRGKGEAFDASDVMLTVLVLIGSLARCAHRNIEAVPQLRLLSRDACRAIVGVAHAGPDAANRLNGGV